jgi:hypothetical protein
MTLQKMKYSENKKPVVCAVNTEDRGGEFTVCGNNCLDAAAADFDDWDIIGDSFSGKLQEVTCPNCLRHIQYIKGLV